MFDFRQIFRLYDRHLQLVILPFESVLDNDEILGTVRNRKYRRYYLFPIFLNLFLVGDTLVQIYLYGNELENPRVFHRKIMEFLPTFFMDQADICFVCNYSLALSCHIFLYFDHFANTDYTILLSKPFHSELEKLLIKFWIRFKKRMDWFIRVTNIEIWTGISGPLIVYQIYKIYVKKYVPSFRDYMCVALCQVCFRSVITTIHIGVEFLGKNSMIQLKQRYFFKKIDNSLNRKMGSVWELYQKCRKTMKTILKLTHEVDRNNAFFSKYLTSIILLFGFLGCAVFNALYRKGHEVNFLQRWPWAWFGTLYFVNIFLISGSCSITIQQNVKLFKSLRKLQVRILSFKYISRYQSIQLDLVNEYKLLLQKCSFRLSNSSMINNKFFFFTIFTTVSVFYMKLVTGESLLKISKV